MSEDTRPVECSVIVTDKGAKVVVPCWALEECLDAQYGRGTKYQGLTQPYLVNMTTHKHSRSPIVFKGGKHTKPGLTVNFCPFCGSNVKTHEEEE